MAAHDRADCLHCPSRRAILKGGATGVLLAALPAALPAGCGPMGPPTPINVADVPVGTLRVIGSQGVVLGRDDRGLYAMSAVCTHAGCLVSVVGGNGAESLYCGCHASAFDSNGVVTHGPALVDLRHFPVELAADGTITIREDLPALASDRTPVVVVPDGGDGDGGDGSDGTPIG
jgi:Rieske Fe-S protein